jgi:hypothetical protein
MTPADLTNARAALGALWGLGRPLYVTELGRILRFPATDPAQSIRDYEDGVSRIPGPVSVAIDMLLAGAQPPDGLEAMRKAG